MNGLPCCALLKAKFFVASSPTKRILRGEGKEKNRMRRIVLLLFTVAAIAAITQAQAAPPPATPTPDPAMTQIRKAVTFIKLVCKKGPQTFIARGTGFFVGYPVVYLVTNRHVALCLDDSGNAMQVESISIRMNRRTAQDDNFSEDVVLNEHGNVAWTTPQDDSVDLAVYRFPNSPNEQKFDYRVVPLSMLAARDDFVQNQVIEGGHVFFAGFFQQFPGTKRMQPIIRQGIIAMMPDEKIPFVGKSEKVYLADLHVFHGNSGSPAFINLGGFRNGSLFVGDNYKLIGVVNAYVVEDEHLNLKLEKHVVTAAVHSAAGKLSLEGTGDANSGVSTIVPSDELRDLLDAAQPQQ